MARDLITGTSPTDWSRNGHGILGGPLAVAERVARREAQAFKLDLISTGARALGVVAFLGGVVALGYNQMKSRQEEKAAQKKKASISDGWDW
jgi:hypothetical protein